MRSAADSEARRTSGPNKARLAEEENWTKLDYFDAEVRRSFVIVDLFFACYLCFVDFFLFMYVLFSFINMNMNESRRKSLR